MHMDTDADVVREIYKHRGTRGREFVKANASSELIREIYLEMYLGTLNKNQFYMQKGPI